MSFRSRAYGPKAGVAVLFLVCLGAAWDSLAGAAIINVPDDYATIQEAIDAAEDGDEIIVAQGTYCESIDLLGKAIIVRSTDPDDPDVVENTIIDGSGANHVVQCISGEGPDTELSGFTITGGNADGEEDPDYDGGGLLCLSSSPTVDNCAIVGNAAAWYGGGVYCDDASAILTDCTITQNTCYYGAGMFCKGQSCPILFGCIISDNVASRDGAGILCEDALMLTLIGCTVSENTADEGTGGIRCCDCSTILTDCTISGNTSDGSGGGVACWHCSVTLTNCTISGNTGGLGGGIQCCDCSTVLTNCTILENTADYGGGVWCDEESGECTLTLINCTIGQNEAVQGRGGGVCCGSDCSATLTDCTIVENEAGSIGGGVYSLGGDDDLALTNCVISGNTAGDSGGGVFCAFAPSLTLTDCTIDGNSAVENGGGVWNLGHTVVELTRCTITQNTAHRNGGGVYCDNPDHPATLTNCTVTENTAADSAGGVYCHGGDYTATNCLVVDNAATNCGGGLYCSCDSLTLTNATLAGNSASFGPALACGSPRDRSTVTMSNCTLWNGVDQIWNNNGSMLTLAWCDVQGGWEGEGNIDADPLFFDPDNGDYHLLWGSPCVDAADNTAVPPDEFDLDDDGDTDEPCPFDLEGNLRFIDDPGTEDTGHGEPPLVDMGAYEFVPCPGDVNGDRTVNTSDLLIVLAQWGTNARSAMRTSMVS